MGRVLEFFRVNGKLGTAAFALLVLTSCGGGGGGSASQTGGTTASTPVAAGNSGVNAVINPRVKVVPDAQAQVLIVLSDEQISLVNTPVYAAGDILVFPDRLLKVTAIGIPTADGRTIYYVTRAALGDAFDSLSISSAPNVSTNSAVPQSHANLAVDTTSTVALDQWTTGFSSDKGLFTASSDCTVSTKPAQYTRNGVAFSGGTLDMKCQFTSDNGNGSALIDGTVGIYGKFSDLSFNFDTNHLEAASARVTFEGVTQRIGNVKVIQTGSFSIKDKEFLLGTIKIPFRLPPNFVIANAALNALNANWVIPLKIVFSANGDASAQFDLNTSRVDYFKVKYSQADGAPAKTSNTKQIDSQSVTANFVGDASVDMFSGLQMGVFLQEDVYGDKFDGLIGMQVTVGPKVVIKSNLIAGSLNQGVSFSCSAKWQLHAYLDAVLKFGLDFDKLWSIWADSTSLSDIPGIAQICKVYPPNASATVKVARIGSYLPQALNVAATNPVQVLTLPKSKNVNIYLDGSASSAGGASTLKYEWSTSKPASIKFIDPAASVTSATVDCLGSCAAQETITLKVTTAQVPPQASTTTFNISFDSAPVADAVVTIDQTGKLNLNGAASVDEGIPNRTTKFAWTFPDGTSTNTFEPSIGLDAGVKNVASGNIVSLQLTDQFNQANSKKVLVSQRIESSTTPTVSSISCKQSVSGQAMACNIIGFNLPVGLNFQAAGCSNAIESPQSNQTQRVFSCVPGSAGALSISVSVPGGALLKTEIVTVALAPVTAIPAPAVNTVSPIQVVANNTNQVLSISGANFQVGNIVQFKWSIGTGAGVWTTGKQVPSIASASSLSVNFNPGAVADTINVRVCRSSLSMAAADCSSGIHAIDITQVAVAPLAFVSAGLGVISVTTVGYQPMLVVSGNVTQVSFSWTGATTGSTTWVKNDANWLAKVTVNGNGTLNLRPIVTTAADLAGTTQWTVSIRDSLGASKSQSFSVVYQPPVCVLPKVIVNGVCTTPPVAAQPDLAPQAVTFSSSTIAAGGSVTVNYNVVNTGGAASPASTTRVQIVTPSGTIYTQPDFSTPAIAAGSQLAESRTISMASAPAGTYIAYVIVDFPRTANQSNMTNDTSPGATFTVQAAVSVTTAPTPTSPINSVVVGNTAPTLTWSGGSNMGSLQVNVSKSPYGAANIVYTSAYLSSGTTAVVPTTLTSGTNYRWDVTACSSANGAGTCVTGGNALFSTPAPAVTTAPTPASPINSVVVGNTAPTLSWSGGSNIGSLQVNISKSPYGPANIVYTSAYFSAGTTSIVPSGLTAGTSYRWDVTACSGASGAGICATGGNALFSTPAAAVSLVVNGIASSYSATTFPYQPTIFLTGSGFSSVVNTITLACTKNGVSCGNYVRTAANWSAMYFITNDNSATISPVLALASDAAGTYNWTVTFAGGGQSTQKSFTVIK